MMLIVLAAILSLNLLDQTQDVTGASPTCLFFTDYGLIDAVNLAKSKKGGEKHKTEINQT